jgi:hypothetical protein
VHDNGAKAQSCIVQKICTTGSQSLLSLPGTLEKNFSLNFKRYNLTIRAVKCRETFCTCSPSSLVQDPTVEKISFGLLELEMADLEHFLRKTPLVLLGLIELSVKSSKESTETVSLLKTGNKVVEVG